MAEILLEGRKIASHASVVGSFGVFFIISWVFGVENILRKTEQSYIHRFCLSVRLFRIADPEFSDTRMANLFHLCH